MHLAPTLLGVADVPVPKEFQGVNLWPQIQSGLDWSSTAVAECIAGCANPFRSGQCNGNRMLAVRDRRYKLVLSFDVRSEQTLDSLFDLESDPGERRALPASNGHPERVRLLRIALDHLKRSKGSLESGAYLRTRMRMIKQSLVSKRVSLPMSLAEASVPTPVQ